MYSLVEGMEQHGLKWAKIHKDYKDLENKTQVRGRGEGGRQGGGRSGGWHWGPLRGAVGLSAIGILGGVLEGYHRAATLARRDNLHRRLGGVGLGQQTEVQ